MFDWIRSLFGSTSDDRDGRSGVIETRQRRDGWSWDREDEQPYGHYTEAVDDIKQLKRDRDHEAAEELLLWCIDYTEAEAEHEAEHGRFAGQVAPAYYRHLAIVYRKDDRYDDEVEILDRYAEVCREHGNDPDDDLVERLEKARSLAEGE